MTQEDGKTHSKAPTYGKVFVDLMHDLSITDGAIRLYAHMHWRYGRNKQNFEGQGSMAEAMGVTEKTIRKRIDELEAKDWIVTLYRDRTDKGNWTTCFYHVFESQDECRQFRDDYKAPEGEEIKPKPDARDRISRKGAGNPNPTIPQNSSSDGDDTDRKNSGSDGQQNSSSDDGKNSSSTDRQNSGSDYLSVVYPAKANLPVDNPSGSKASPSQDIDDQGRATTTAGVFQRYVAITTNAPTATDRETIPDDIKTYGLDIINKALDRTKLRVTAGKHVRSWKYVQPILEEIKQEKQPLPKVPAKGSPGPHIVNGVNMGAQSPEEIALLAGIHAEMDAKRLAQRKKVG